LCEGKNCAVEGPWMNEIIEANATKDERRMGGEREEQ
jgi:hypothetical protein